VQQDKNKGGMWFIYWCIPVAFMWGNGTEREFCAICSKDWNPGKLYM